MLCIGHTGEQLSECFSKHRCDIKNRPKNSELAKNFDESLNLNDDLNRTIYKTISKPQPHEGIMRVNMFGNYKF